MKSFPVIEVKKPTNLSYKLYITVTLDSNINLSVIFLTIDLFAIALFCTYLQIIYKTVTPDSNINLSVIFLTIDLFAIALFCTYFSSYFNVK